LFYVGGWLISRRPGRAVVPWAAAWFVLMMAPGSAHSSSGLVAAGAGATARVVAVKTQTAAVGIYETIVDSIPTRCVRVDVCPGRVRAHVWGGTMGGITQVVGDIPPPQVDDEVDLAFTGVASGATAEGSVLAVRRP
jgi:hypothetical protein